MNNINKVLSKIFLTGSLIFKLVASYKNKQSPPLECGGDFVCYTKEYI